MKEARTKRIAADLLALVLVLSLLPAASAAGENDWAANIPAMLSAGPYVEGEVIAAVDPACADDFDLLVLMGLKEDLEGEDLMTVPEEDASAGEAVLTLISRPGRTTEELLYALAGDDRVVYAEPDYITERPEPANDAGLTAALEQAAGTASLQGDGDRWAGFADHKTVADLTELQWGQKAIHTPNFGATGSNMEGDPIVVAVMDEPVDFSNPDLAPVAFTFTDDEQKALCCDVHGFNALSEDGKLEVIGADTHGTHVAGIIGAAWDGHGVSGVASNVRIISIQLAHNSKLSNKAVLRGFEFVRRAREAGVNIRLINNSWGGPELSLAVNAAVRALGEEYGVVSVFAAGNSTEDVLRENWTCTTLAQNPYAIGVAACDEAGLPAWFTNYSDSIVTLAAPGAGILSTVMPEDGLYLPDATPATNSFYEGFEGDTPRVEAAQYGGEIACAVTTDQALSGRHSLALTLDPDALVEYDDHWNACCLKLTLHGIKADPGEYLGLSILAPGEAQVFWHYWDEGGEGYILGDYYSDSTCWASVWLDGPEGAADPKTSDLTVSLDCLFEKGVDMIWLDSVGLGRERTPYGNESGTSMACPLVTGAAAVLAAANPDLKGAALADLVRTKVRQEEAWQDQVISGGVFDFVASTPYPSSVSYPDSGAPLYDTSLPLDTGTGDPYWVDFDAMGDSKIRGPLAGLGNKLYYIACTEELETYSEGYFMLMSFDLSDRTWKAEAPLPEDLYRLSAIAWQDKLLVCGTGLDREKWLWTTGHVWSYDPAEGGGWVKCTWDGVLSAQVFLTIGEKLYLTGGWVEGVDPVTGEDSYGPGNLSAYDPETGAEPILTLNDSWDNHYAAALGETIYLFSGEESRLARVTAEGEEDVSDALPADADMENAVLLSCGQGLLLVGATSADEKTDTWLLKDGSNQFEPLLRKTSAVKTFASASCVYRDKVYVIGMAGDEKDTRFFRANDVKTLTDMPEGQIQRVRAAGTSVNVTAMASASVTGAELYCAAYGEDGRMITAASTPVESDGKVHDYSLTLARSDYHSVKAFLLDGSGRPLCESVKTDA